MTASEQLRLARVPAAHPVVYLARRNAGRAVTTVRLAGTGAVSGLSDPPFPAVDREIHLARHTLSRHWAFGGSDDSEQDGQVLMHGPGVSRAFHVNVLRHADDADSAVIVVQREDHAQAPAAAPGKAAPGPAIHSSDLRKLIDALPVGVEVRDEHGMRQFAGGFMFPGHGCPASPAARAAWADGGKEWRERQREADRQVLSTGASCEYVVESGPAKGGRWFHCIEFPVPASPGAGPLIGSLIMDVTRQKQLEQDAQGLSERRRELLGTQREFISMVSHEFRTPLTTIEGAQYLLERLLYESAGLNAAVAANVSKWFGLQASALATLRKLVDQVLMLNRTEHVTGEASLELLSPGDVLREAVAGFNDSMDTPRVTLVDGTPAGYAASMDPGLVKAAAENLISNGLKYSRPDSVVGVRVFAEPGGWVLEVADGGRGIPSEDQAKLFRPFFRAGNVGAVPGTGLGLAIVQRAVDFHTGRIEFESGENSGTRFTLHLPMCPHPLVDGGPPTRESPLGSE